MDFLNLTSLKQHAVKEDEHDYHVEAACKRADPPCTHCHSKNTVGFGRKRQLFMDSPVRGKRVGIWVDRRRFQCKACDRTYLEPLPDMDDRRLATKRLINFIEKESLKRTFSSIADDTGLNEKTVRNIFRDYINRLEKEVRIDTPRWMGIDEIHIIKKPRCIISNIEHQTVVDLLINRNKTTVARYLQKLPGRNKVNYVAMDMWNPYRDAITTVMPQALIVVDKFHVLRMANQAVETIRKSLRASLKPNQRRGLMHDRFILLKRRHDLDDAGYLKLSGWTENYPVLGAAYDAKEAFYAIWDQPNRKQAERAYKIWLDGVSSDISGAYQPLITAVKNWRQEIFNYFDHPITNAYTESLNNLVRIMNRIGRGYSFEALRAKILFTEGVKKTKKPSYNKDKYAYMESFVMCDMMSAMLDDDQKNYGAKISTLIEMIEQGKI